MTCARQTLRVPAPLLLLAVLCSALAAAGGCDRAEPQADVVRVPADQTAERSSADAPAPERPGTSEEPHRRRPPGGSVLYAPADYLQTTVIDAPRAASQKISKAYVTNDIRLFHAMEGRYPESLAELEEWRGEPFGDPPAGHTYDYDPSTGAFDVVPVP